MCVRAHTEGRSAGRWLTVTGTVSLMQGAAPPMELVWDHLHGGFGLPVQQEGKHPCASDEQASCLLLFIGQNRSHDWPRFQGKNMISHSWVVEPAVWYCHGVEAGWGRICIHLTHFHKPGSHCSLLTFVQYKSLGRGGVTHMLLCWLAMHLLSGSGFPGLWTALPVPWHVYSQSPNLMKTRICLLFVSQDCRHSW